MQTLYQQCSFYVFFICFLPKDKRKNKLIIKLNRITYFKETIEFKTVLILLVSMNYSKFIISVNIYTIAIRHNKRCINDLTLN